MTTEQLINTLPPAERTEAKRLSEQLDCLISAEVNLRRNFQEMLAGVIFAETHLQEKKDYVFEQTTRNAGCFEINAAGRQTGTNLVLEVVPREYDQAGEGNIIIRFPHIYVGQKDSKDRLIVGQITGALLRRVLGPNSINDKLTFEVSGFRHQLEQLTTECRRTQVQLRELLAKADRNAGYIE